MDKDYEVIDGEHGIIRETKEREYHYPRTLFTKSLEESIKELSDEFTKAIEEVFICHITANGRRKSNVHLKDYMARKKEDEKRARRKQKSKQHKRRTAKRTAHSES